MTDRDEVTGIELETGVTAGPEVDNPPPPPT